MTHFRGVHRVNYFIEIFPNGNQFLYQLRFSVATEAIIWALLHKNDVKSTINIFRMTVPQLPTMKVKSIADVTRKTEIISLQLVRVNKKYKKKNW